MKKLFLSLILLLVSSPLYAAGPAMMVGAGAWKDDSDADAVTAMSTEPTVVYFGFNTVTDDVYIDDVFIYSTRGI